MVMVGVEGGFFCGEAWIWREEGVGEKTVFSIGKEAWC
jgi:hypothetical protein